jgi:hypothetical protein
MAGQRTDGYTQRGTDEPPPHRNRLPSLLAIIVLDLMLLATAMLIVIAESMPCKLCSVVMFVAKFPSASHFESVSVCSGGMLGFVFNVRAPW